MVPADHSSRASSQSLEVRPLRADKHAMPYQVERAEDLAAKRCLDVCVAALMLFSLLPLILVICLLVWGADGRSPIFRHRRIGRHGNIFECLKIRTMVADSEHILQRYLADNPSARMEWEQTQKLSRDPRVTPFGNFLRKSSLDELPQLINVLRGEMSLVGPRPIIPAEIDRYGSAFEHCFSVRPGVTGLWQVSGRSDCNYEQRVALDIQYINRLSFSRDLLILLRTVPAVLQKRGSR
jgi:exopolysaccharide production protein ExoY